jgi:hypothetical protein
VGYEDVKVEYFVTSWSISARYGGRGRGVGSTLGSSAINNVSIATDSSEGAVGFLVWHGDNPC